MQVDILPLQFSERQMATQLQHNRIILRMLLTRVCIHKDRLSISKLAHQWAKADLQFITLISIYMVIPHLKLLDKIFKAKK